MCNVTSEAIAAVYLNSLWLLSVALRTQSISGWSGFNQLVAEKNSVIPVSDVVVFPFINLDPNNLSTLYTALLFVQSEASKYELNDCIVAFSPTVVYQGRRYHRCLS